MDAHDKREAEIISIFKADSARIATALIRGSAGLLQQPQNGQFALMRLTNATPLPPDCFLSPKERLERRAKAYAAEVRARNRRMQVVKISEHDEPSMPAWLEAGR